MRELRDQINKLLAVMVTLPDGDKKRKIAAEIERLPLTYEALLKAKAHLDSFGKLSRPEIWLSPFFPSGKIFKVSAIQNGVNMSYSKECNLFHQSKFWTIIVKAESEAGALKIAQYHYTHLGQNFEILPAERSA